MAVKESESALPPAERRRVVSARDLTEHKRQNGALSVTLSAPLKINLLLHILGRNADGYHNLESLAVFSHSGDALHLRRAQYDSFCGEGNFAAGLGKKSDNLAIKARDALRRCLGEEALPPVALLLRKNLPIAAGLGGGSADAAACLFGLCALNGIKDSASALRRELWRIAAELGADVPMCLSWFYQKNAVMARGRGEKLAVLPHFPALAVVAVNNGAPLSTKAVFARFAESNRTYAGSILQNFENMPIMNFREAVAFLRQTRNDLMPAALDLAPSIAEILAVIKASGAAHSAMSGSGSSCFGIYPNLAEAQKAAYSIKRQYPHWFVLAAKTDGAAPLSA